VNPKTLWLASSNQQSKINNPPSEIQTSNPPSSSSPPHRTAASRFSNPPEKGARASRLFSHPKNRRQKNLGKTVWKVTLAPNETHREFSRLRRLPAWTGDFCDRSTAHRRSDLSADASAKVETPLPPPVPRQPLRLGLAQRSVASPPALSTAFIPNPNSLPQQFDKTF
jgi:hypothetical protein